MLRTGESCQANGAFVVFAHCRYEESCEACQSPFYCLNTRTGRHSCPWVFICPASSGKITFYCIFGFMALIFGFPLSNLEVIYNRGISKVLRLYYSQKHHGCVVIGDVR